MSEPNLTSGAAASQRYSAFGRVFRLARKELREILRDRRTIVTLIAMPLLLYPLMSIVFQQMYLATRAPERGPVYRVGALTQDEFKVFERRFHEGVLQRRADLGKPVSKQGMVQRSDPQLILFTEVQPWPARTPDERAEILEQLKEKLRTGAIDLVIDIANLDPAIVEQGIVKDQEWPCQIYYVPTMTYGRAALADVETMFAAVNAQNLKQRLGVPGRAPRINLFRVQPVTVDVPETGAISLAALVPLILILMTITGAVYPAIDLTAGERERGTLEILVAAPVSRFELLSAKYISVLTVAVLTALVNLTCMMITVSWSGLGSALFREQEFSIPTLLQILALLLLFAAFFSALLLCLTSFARSFKEAQAYLIPLMLASLTPGVMAMLPGLKLEGILRVLPLVNIVLLARDLFDGPVEALVVATVVLTTLFYALAALALAARVFGAESVLYSEQSSWADLLRRPDTSQSAASLPMALWCLALMVPLHFSLTALAQTLTGLPLTVRIMLQVLVNVLMFGCLPALFIYVGRVELVAGLGLRAPSRQALWLGLLAGLVLGASIWPIQLAILAQRQLDPELQEQFGQFLRQFKRAQESLGWSVLLVVIVPAILEEFFFRGFLYQALLKRASPLATIGITGLLFGLTHVILDGALGLERLAPATLLGFILGTIRWRTGSLWPGVILHVGHNTILMIVGIASEGATEEVPWTWIAGGAGGALLGAGLLWLGGASPERSAPDRT